MKPGQDATLQLWRGGHEQDVTVRITELKDQPPTAANPAAPQDHGASSHASALGLTVRALTAAEKSQAGAPQGGLLVEEVTGPAAAAEVEPGDVILGVNGKRVRTTQELQDAAKSAGKNVALLVQREDAQIFIPLRLP
jgi:serine protease Do